jgi:hypothetical protein
MSRPSPVQRKANTASHVAQNQGDAPNFQKTAIPVNATVTWNSQIR